MDIGSVVNDHGHGYKHLVPMDVGEIADTLSVRDFIVETGSGEWRDWGKINSDLAVQSSSTLESSYGTIYPSP